MKEEEKAKEIYDIYLKIQNNLFDNSVKKNGKTISEIKAKKCALICVDEIIKSNPFNLDLIGDSDEVVKEQIKYWQKVKNIIETKY